MGTDRTRAAGSPAHVSFEGKDYSLSPLGIGDLAEFEQYAEDYMVAKTEEKIARLERHGVLPADEKRKILDELQRSIDDGEVSNSVAITFDGLRMMAWLSLRQRHPDLTVELVGRMISLSDSATVQNKLDRISGLAPEPGSDSNPPVALGGGANGSGSTVS